MNCKSYKLVVCVLVLFMLSGCIGSKPLSPEMQKLQIRYDAIPHKAKQTLDTVVLSPKELKLAKLYQNDNSRYLATYSLIERVLQDTLSDLKINKDIRATHLVKYNYTLGPKELRLDLYITQSAYPWVLSGVFKSLRFEFDYKNDAVELTLKDIVSSLQFNDSRVARKHKAISVQNDMSALIDCYEKFDRVFINNLKESRFLETDNTGVLTNVSFAYDASKEVFIDVNNRIMDKHTLNHEPNRDNSSVWKTDKSYTSFKINSTKIVLFLDSMKLSLSKTGTIVSFNVLMYGPKNDVITKKQLEAKLKEIYNQEENSLTNYSLVDDLFINLLTFDIDPKKDNFGFLDMI